MDEPATMEASIKWVVGMTTAVWPMVAMAVARQLESIAMSSLEQKG
jgi:hypothetical protein